MTRRKPKTNQKKKTTDPKVIFRRSKEWHTFREKKRKEQKTDPITGSPLTKQFNLHHLDLDPKHYTDIEKELDKFKEAGLSGYDDIYLYCKSLSGEDGTISELSDQISTIMNDGRSLKYSAHIDSESEISGGFVKYVKE